MIFLDERADTFPSGLFDTPFYDVYRALRKVSAEVWAVQPQDYRAGMTWGWYALNSPGFLEGFRDVVAAALISAFAPMIKATQTSAELVEYLSQWREYRPTFPALEALYRLFSADVNIQPISDAESQSVLPVENKRLAFYVRIESIDFSRPLTLSEAYDIAVKATPLGSRPFPYYALETEISQKVSMGFQPFKVIVENDEIAVSPKSMYSMIDVESGEDVSMNGEPGSDTVFRPGSLLSSEREIAEVSMDGVATSTVFRPGSLLSSEREIAEVSMDGVDIIYT